MPARTVAAIGLASSLLLAPAASRALSADDCQLWLAQLRVETASASITGAKSAHERERLLGRLDDASLRQPRATLIESLKQVTKFQEHAATLAADGKVTPVEGQRLGNLSETVRRCIDRVRGSRER